MSTCIYPYCIPLTLYHSVDERILQHMVDTGAEFLMEVTDKTKADVKVR